MHGAFLQIAAIFPDPLLPARQPIAIGGLIAKNGAQADGIGWIAWSWKGNGGPSRVLDMSRAYARADLTAHRGDVIDGPDGIRATTKTDLTTD